MRDGVDGELEMGGQYLYGLADENSTNVHLKYKEFSPTSFEYIPAEVTPTE